MDSTDEVTIVDPGGKLIRVRANLSKRRLVRGGPAIGILFNTKPNGDVLMREVAKALQQRYAIDNLVFESKNLPGEGVSDAAIESLSHCSIVLAGTGD